MVSPTPYQRQAIRALNMRVGDISTDSARARTHGHGLIEQMPAMITMYAQRSAMRKILNDP